MVCVHLPAFAQLVVVQHLVHRDRAQGGWGPGHISRKTVFVTLCPTTRGVQGVAYVLSSTEEEIEGYLASDDDGYGDDHSSGHRLLSNAGLGAASRRLSGSWSAEEYQEHLHSYLDLICWCIFCHLLAPSARVA